MNNIGNIYFIKLGTKADKKEERCFENGGYLPRGSPQPTINPPLFPPQLYRNQGFPPTFGRCSP